MSGLVSDPSCADCEAVFPGCVRVDGGVDFGWAWASVVGVYWCGLFDVCCEVGDGLGVQGPGVQVVVHGSEHVLFGQAAVGVEIGLQWGVDAAFEWVRGRSELAGGFQVGVEIGE